MSGLWYFQDSEYDDDAVRAWIQNNPGDCGDYPLHLVLNEGGCSVSSETARVICDAFPKALATRNMINETALHTACRIDATLEVVHLLCRRRPKSLKEKDGNGRTPLHVACNYAAMEVAKYLAEQCPEAMAETDSLRETPLAVAFFENPKHELVEFLVKKHPNAIKVTDLCGRLPLHRAVTAATSLETIALLIDAYPEAVNTKSGNGNTPLHYACKFAPRMHMETLILLVLRYPEALKIHNIYGETPLECVLDNRNQFSEVVDMLKALEHFHSSNATEEGWAMDVLRYFESKKCPDGVGLVLDSFPSLVAKLDLELMPYVFAFVGRRCKLETFFSMLQDNPVIVKGAVKRSAAVGQPASKKARK